MSSARRAELVIGRVASLSQVGDLKGQLRNRCLQNVPDEFRIDSRIIVHDAIAQTGYLQPWNRRVLVLEFGWRICLALMARIHRQPGASAPGSIDQKNPSAEGAVSLNRAFSASFLVRSYSRGVAPDSCEKSAVGAKEPRMARMSPICGMCPRSASAGAIGPAMANLGGY